jgi:tRNA (cytidine56-2'-O)-methyltransferase
MYGSKIVLKINQIIKRIKNKDLLIIIGGPKVDRFYYESVDYNISVTNQPHSEVAALAILLNYLNPDCLFKDDFKNKVLKIKPNRNKKNVTTLK